MLSPSKTLLLRLFACTLAAVALGVDARNGLPQVRTPVRWHIGKVDPKFNLSREQARAAAERALRVWESEQGKQLFVYDEESGFPVTFVFDERQEHLNATKAGRDEIESARVTLDSALKEEQEAMAKYRAAEDQLDADSQAHRARIRAYNQKVDEWNARGGAPGAVLADLDAERERLKTAERDLERAGRQVDRLVQEANRLVDDYNLLLSQFKSLTQRFNEKFGEPVKQKIGECVVSGRHVKMITIYGFLDHSHLSVVLAHEFGHALGLKHVKGEGSVMSAVEDEADGAVELKLTARDKAELGRVLGK